MAAEHEPNGSEAFHPIGTIVVLVLFLAVLVILWGAVYVILLSRGVTV